MLQQSARHAPSPATTPHLRPADVAKLPFLRTLGGHRRYPEHEIRELAAGLRQEVAA